MSKVLVISTSLRAKSNSDILTEKLIEGAKASGHDVEHISLKGKISDSVSDVWPVKIHKNVSLRMMLLLLQKK